MITQKKIQPDVLPEWQYVLNLLDEVGAYKSTEEEASRNRQAAIEEVKHAVETYNAARLKLFQERLKELGENWCSVWHGGVGHLVDKEPRPMLIY